MRNITAADWLILFLLLPPLAPLIGLFALACHGDQDQRDTAATPNLLAGKQSS